MAILLLKAVNFAVYLEEKQKFLINFAFFISIFAIVLISLKVIFMYLMPFLIGAIIAYAVQKPAKFISIKIHIKKTICAAILSFFIFVLICLIIAIFVWLIITKSDSIIKYITSLADYLENLLSKLSSLVANTYNKFDGSFQMTFERVVSDTVSDFSSKIATIISESVTSLIKNIPTIFITAIITVVASCYIAKDYDKLKKFFIGIISDKLYKNIVTIKNLFSDSIMNFILGYAKILIITFVELMVGFIVLGVEHSIIISLLISIIDLLPIIGTGTILVPWSIFLFLQNNFKLGFGIAILYIIICIVRNFLEPKIIAGTIGMNPLFILISMFVGLKVAGIIGIIIFPVSLIVTFTFYRNKFSLVKRTD